MSSKNSSNFREAVTSPWRLVSQNEPRSDSLLSREALLPDPTHVSPFLYPTSPPSQRRKPRHDSECTMEVRSSSAPARAMFGPLTMGWSFQKQLQDLDKQSDRDDHDPRSPSGKLGSKKPPARSACTSSARTSRPLSHSPTYPSQIPAALAHTALVESQILNSSNSNGRSSLMPIEIGRHRQRINSMWRQKGPTGRKSGPPNAAAGPSTMHPPQRRTGKRNSTSPREDPDNVPGTGSPPTKKPRQSPVDPPPGPAYPQHAAQPGQPGSSMGPPGGPGPGPGPHQPTLGGMRPPMPGGGPPGGPMNVNGFGQPMGGMGGIGMNTMNGPALPHTINAMSPPMGGGMAGQQGMMTPQIQPTNPPGRPPPLDGPIQCHNSLANFHQRQLAPMSPLSPGMNKDGSAKDINMKIEGSPRGGLPPSSAGMAPTASGPANGPSSMPVPPGRPLSSQNPAPNSGPHPGMTSLPPPNMDPSPGSMLGNTPMPGMSGPMSGMPNGIGPGGMGSGMVGINCGINAMNGTGSDIPFFRSDFMNDIEVGGLDTFDPQSLSGSKRGLEFQKRLQAIVQSK
ncbi:uncharacterized protein C8R40DRAFT_1171054 [Lentinula edodes]|uniref:uncharacterized protein n=1 Tax=Lentinula edodes TaxID=5353 RepID=UPI001E8E301F|nr:uncharacterized protein C8R40DRAFT_1171054 [Lentinula edodes]KAH7874948.1 hypothetical protein C8R40DRAFT_1171054 [Lentinula edodes]